jgi:hypothetical protein
VPGLLRPGSSFEVIENPHAWIPCWTQNSHFTGELFTSGIALRPQGRPPHVSPAKLAGDRAKTMRLAADALDYDAKGAREGGRILRGANVVGNAWSYWYDQITGA